MNLLVPHFFLILPSDNIQFSEKSYFNSFKNDFRCITISLHVPFECTLCQWSPKEVLYAWEVERQMVVSFCVGAGNIDGTSAKATSGS